MNIEGKITGIKYEIKLSKELDKIDLKHFNINETPATCLVLDNNHSFAVSKWVSPKRTRSYPYERVYNTLHISKKITVIPIVKDEGAKGDRDYLQWDTVSLMSLLDVFVIFAYYDKAIINPRNHLKITAQKFNNDYILSKIKEISQYHSSALHWNLNELNTNLHTVLNNAKNSYIRIEKETGVPLHNFKGFDILKEKIGADVSNFMQFSREKAKQAQAREFVTEQPKERLSTLSKAAITISNYLGGKYFFTVDEVNHTNEKVFLIESKHSKTGLLPSKGDIKDGLLKMILYSNLYSVNINHKKVKSHAILQLTSSKLKGNITSSNNEKEVMDFLEKNNFSSGQIKFIKILFKEAQTNFFTVKISHSI